MRWKLLPASGMLDTGKLVWKNLLCWSGRKGWVGKWDLLTNEVNDIDLANIGIHGLITELFGEHLGISFRIYK